MKTNITDLEIENIHIIEKLWIKNSEFHRSNSEYFNTPLEEGIFNKRISSWKKAGNLKITISSTENHIVGYCISTITNKNGSIESLYVDTDFRRRGIAANLAKSHLKWFNDFGCEKSTVTTVYKNADALGFYKSIGLFPKTITLEEKKI
jgi:ribosomal protein S18 acetylase RimI-like enzyme